MVFFLFLIWDYKEDSFPVCARGVGLSCFGVFVEEQSSGFHKEFSSPTCLWVVQLNKHFHRKRQDICLKQEEEKIKNLGLFTFCSPLQQHPVTTVCQSSRKKQTSSRPVRLWECPHPPVLVGKILLINLFKPFVPFCDARRDKEKGHPLKITFKNTSL